MKKAMKVLSIQTAVVNLIKGHNFITGSIRENRGSQNPYPDPHKCVKEFFHEAFI